MPHGPFFLPFLDLPSSPSWRMIASRADLHVQRERGGNPRSVRATPVFRSHSGMIPTRRPHVKRFRLATGATLVGVLMAAGCASPCGRPFMDRFSSFRWRRACPCDCEGGPPLTGGGQIVSDGPILGDPPGPLPPNLGAPTGPLTGPPAVPPPDGRIAPIPPPAQGVPAGPSSLKRIKT
jgi:hypothetical protein